MKSKFVFATNNNNKLVEIQQIIGNKWEILSLKEIKCFDEIPETQNTLAGNALQKARYVYDKFNLNCFADDTGLEVNALNGLPGVKSARYAGNEQNSEKNIHKLLEELNNKGDRRARFVTIIALIIDEKEYFFEGIINGQIAEEPVGTNGFGYDPVFIPEGFNESFAEIPSEIKNRISHRAQAIEKLKFFFRNYE